MFVSADCYPAKDSSLRRAQKQAWRDHVRRTYSAIRTRSLFESWSREDVYVALEAEVEELTGNGFSTSVVWRKGAFAVLAARKRRSCRAADA